MLRKGFTLVELVMSTASRRLTALLNPEVGRYQHQVDDLGATGFLCVGQKGA